MFGCFVHKMSLERAYYIKFSFSLPKLYGEIKQNMRGMTLKLNLYLANGM